MFRDWLKYFVWLTVIVFVCLLSMMTFAIRESLGSWAVMLFLIGQTALCAYFLVLLNEKADRK